MARVLPTLILVPGAWHDGPQHYSSLIDRLRSAGYEVNALEMPTISDDPSTKTYQDDYIHVQNALRKATDEAGKDVVVVMHSRGGHIGSDAVKGFSKAERAAQGLAGGIVHLVYLCAFIIPEGLSIRGALGDYQPPWLKVTPPISVPTDVAEVFYNGCPPDEQEKMVRLLKPMALVSDTTPSTYAGWKHMPSTYLVCEQDNALLLRFQEGMISQPGANFDVVRCQSGHSPFIALPDFTAEVVRRACGEPI